MREGAVYELKQILYGSHRGQVESALEALGLGGLWLAVPGPLRQAVEEALEAWLRSRPRALEGRFPDPHEMVLPFPPGGRPNPGV